MRVISIAMMTSSLLLAWVFSVAASGGASTTAQQAQDAETAPSFSEPLRADAEITLTSGQGVVVDNPYGSVFVRFGGYTHTLATHSTLQQPAGAAMIVMVPAVREASLVLEPRLPQDVALAEGQRFDLVLYVPQGHPLRIVTSFGAIESRDVKGDVDLISGSGNITVRGEQDTVVLARSDAGDIAVSMSGKARPGSLQRITTRTGSIVVTVSDSLDAKALLTSSGAFTTDYSLSVAHADGAEPDKIGHASIGRTEQGDGGASIVLESLRGDIRISRRAMFVEAPESATSVIDAVP